MAQFTLCDPYLVRLSFVAAQADSAMSTAAKVSQGKVFGALLASFPLAYVVWQTQVRICSALSRYSDDPHSRYDGKDPS